MNIVEIPGTPYIALGDDLNLTPKAIERRTIVLEDHLANCEMVKSLGPFDHVLDIGAFIGDTALIFLQHTRFVTCFEPQDDAFFCLRYNSPLSANFKAAIGDGRAVVRMQDALDGNPGTRTVHEDAEKGEPSLRLDDLSFHPPPTFLKIDVEGFEPAVIAGGTNMIMRYHPRMLIEVYPAMLERHGFTVDGLYAVLKSLGYEWTEVIGNSSEPRWDIGAVWKPF